MQGQTKASTNDFNFVKEDIRDLWKCDIFGELLGLLKKEDKNTEIQNSWWLEQLTFSFPKTYQAFRLHISSQ